MKRNNLGKFGNYAYNKKIFHKVLTFMKKYFII